MLLKGHVVIHASWQIAWDILNRPNQIGDILGRKSSKPAHLHLLK
jgi:hypothetical protein